MLDDVDKDSAEQVSITDEGFIALSATSQPHSQGPDVDLDADPDSMLSLLKNREYRSLLITQFLSIVGDQFARVAVSVLVFDRTNSAFQAAITYALTFVPAIIGGPLLSGLADRRPRRSVLVACDLLRAPLVACVALPSLPIPLAMVLIAAIGLFQGPFEAARGALLPDILTGDRYTKGYALGQIVGQAAQVSGFGLAGVLLLAVSPSALLLLDAASFLGSALLIRFAIQQRPAAHRPETPRAEAWWRHAVPDMRLSARMVMGAADIRPLALLAWTACLFAIGFEALGAPLARASHSSTWTVGLLLAAQPLGTVVGAVFAARIAPAARETVMRWLAAVALLPLCLCLLRPTLPGLLAIGTASGVGMSFNVIAVTLLVSRVPADRRGRALGFVGTGLYVVQGVGVLVAGGLASIIDPRLAMGWLGVVGTAGVCLALIDGRRSAAQVRVDAEPGT